MKRDLQENNRIFISVRIWLNQSTDNTTCVVDNWLSNVQHLYHHVHYQSNKNEGTHTPSLKMRGWGWLMVTS